MDIKYWILGYFLGIVIHFIIYSLVYGYIYRNIKHLQFDVFHFILSFLWPISIIFCLVEIFKFYYKHTPNPFYEEK